MTTFISKESAKRLITDVKKIIKDPLVDQGIYYIHDDSNMLKGYALIVGPSDTPYFGGYYFFEFNYPTDYPHSPPKVKYCTNGNGVRFNPNLYCSGKVCVSLLNTWTGDQWTSCQTISTVLLTLCTLLCSNPLLNEPGVNVHNYDIPNYNHIIEFSNISIAVCDIIMKKKGVYQPFFDHFHCFLKTHFKNNYDTFVEFVNKKKNEFAEKTQLTTSLYDLSVMIDYDLLLSKLEKSKNIMEEESI